MIFKKSDKKATKSQFPFSGKETPVDGLSAIRMIESSIGTLLEGKVALNKAQGQAFSGERSAVFIDDSDKSHFHVLNRLVSALNLPLVIHLQYGSSPLAFLGEDDLDMYCKLARNGGFQLVAKNLQEWIDYTLIAHRIAELLLLPGILMIDRTYIAESVQMARLPEPKLLEKYLGSAGDSIASITPAQKILFGEKRRRIPQTLNIDRPVGVGALFASDKRFEATIARKAFLESHLVEIVRLAMDEFAGLTGRDYSPVEAYQMNDADYAIVAQGVIVNDLSVLADDYRDKKKVKVGILNLPVSVPFPGEQVSEILKGKKAVTILERSGEAHAADSQLFAEIRAALDKAVENGQAGKQVKPWPESAVYQKPTDRPKLISGIYHLSEHHPSGAELAAVIENMSAIGTTRRRFYIGIQFFHSQLRYPKLEMLQQQIQKAYPHLDQLTLTGANSALKIPHPQKKIILQAFWESISTGEVNQTGAWFAKALARALPGKVCGFAEDSLPEAMHPNHYSILSSRDNHPLHQLSPEVDTFIARDSQHLSDLGYVKEQGLLILHSPLSQKQIWEQFSEQQREQIRQRQLKIFFINALNIATEIAAIPGYIDQIALHVLLGAAVQSDPQLDKKNRQKIEGLYQQQLETEFGKGHFLVDELMTAMRRGADQVQVLNWQQLPPLTGLTPVEALAPWTVRQVAHPDGTLYDLARFWDSVGFFYENEQEAQTLTDPFLATGVIPARSAAFRDLTPYRTEVPQLLAENCSGCGLCWTQCPDSALPATIQDMSALVKFAIDRCQKNGEAMVQMQRVGAQLAKQAHRIFAKDELRQYLTLGDLLKDAYDRLVELMKAEGQQLEAMNKEFEHVHALVNDFPIVKTRTFFDEPHKQEKGSGFSLSIAVNPASCKACGECVEVCPENAMEMVPQTGDLIEKYRHNWQFLMDLPEVPFDTLQKFIREDSPATLMNHLLHRKVYHSLVGGDGAYPGSGVKTTLHLLTASVEALMQPRLEVFVKKIAEAIENLEAKIQGRLEDSLRINDFDAFGKKLSKIESGELDRETLAELLTGDQKEIKLDRKQLKRLTALLKRLKTLHQNYRQGANGDGRARLAMVLSTGNLSVWSATYPYNPFPYPFINGAENDIAALGEGVFDSVMNKMAEDFKLLRQTELELSDSYDPKEHNEFFRQFNWHQFNEEELQLCPPVLLVGEAESLSGAAVQGIFRLLASQRPIKVAIISGLGGESNQFAKAGTSNEAQFTSAASTLSQEFGLWALSHSHSLVVQTSVGYPGHFLKGAQKAFQTKLPAIFHLYASEPHHHGLPNHQAVRQEKLAVDSRAFPLFIYDPSLERSFAERLDIGDNPAPGQDWGTREQALIDESGIEISKDLPVSVADWAVQEGRFRSAFRLLKKGEIHDEMIPLTHFLNLSPKDREGKEAFITLYDKDKKPSYIAVSPQMIAMAENRLYLWRLLQDVSGERSFEKAEKIDAEQVEKQIAEKTKAVEAEYSEKLTHLEQEHQQIYHQKLTQKLLTLCGIAQDGELSQQSIREFVSPKAEDKINDKDNQ